MKKKIVDLIILGVVYVFILGTMSGILRHIGLDKYTFFVNIGIIILIELARGHLTSKKSKNND